MPSYADLLTKRLTAAPRRTTRVNVYLDRDVVDALDAARRNLAAARAAGSDSGSSIKAGRLGQLQALVDDLEQELTETTIVAVLQALSSHEEEAARAAHDPSEEPGDYVIARLERAFQRWETPAGEPVDELDVTQWRRILDVSPAAELTAWTARLNSAGTSPEFPTSPRL